MVPSPSNGDQSARSTVMSIGSVGARQKACFRLLTTSMSSASWSVKDANWRKCQWLCAGCGWNRMSPTSDRPTTFPSASRKYW